MLSAAHLSATCNATAAALALSLSSCSVGPCLTLSLSLTDCWPTSSCASTLPLPPAPVLLRKLRQDELTKLFQRVDPQQEGAVKFDKFCDCMMQPMKNPETENEILEAFRAFDYQGGGTIAAAEFQTVMRNYGEALSDDEVDEILKVAQQQCEVQPGIIDYRRLTKMMCQ